MDPTQFLLSIAQVLYTPRLHFLRNLRQQWNKLHRGSQVVILGDLNLQLATPSSSSATNFQQILDQFGLTQHVSVPTHKGGGWLDVVITRDDCTPTVDVWPPVLSDHGLVVANLPFLHETPVYALRQIRGWKPLDRQAFSTSLSSVPAFSDPSRLR